MPKAVTSYMVKKLFREVGKETGERMVAVLGARKGLKLVNYLKKSGMGISDMPKLVANVSDDGLKTLLSCATKKMPAEKLLYLCKNYNLLDNYTDDVLQMLGKSTHSAEVVYGLLDKYGDDLVDFYSRHGDDAIEILSKHGDELYALPESYRMEAIDLVMSYGDEVLEGIRKYGDDFMARYADEGDTFVQEYLMKGDEVFKVDGVPGVYTDKIKWGIHEIEVRPAGNGFWGQRIKQSDPRVEAFELKINPQNESYYLPHPEGGYVQFENMVNATVQDGKLIMQQKSFYHVYEMPDFAKNKVLEEAKRQIEAACAANYKVEWLVSDESAVNQLTDFFKEQNLDIVVTFYLE